MNLNYELGSSAGKMKS